MERFASLIGVLDEEIAIYKRLLNIIISEYESFAARDYDSIHKHIELKETFYKEITVLESKREEEIALLRSHIPHSQISTLSELIEIVELPVRESLSLRRTTLRLLIDRITEANNRNRIFLDRSREVFTGIMDNIKKLAGTHRSNVYGNKGKLDGNQDSPNPMLLNKEA